MLILLLIIILHILSPSMGCCTPEISSSYSPLVMATIIMNPAASNSLLSMYTPHHTLWQPHQHPHSHLPNSKNPANAIHHADYHQLQAALSITKPNITQSNQQSTTHPQVNHSKPNSYLMSKNSPGLAVATSVEEVSIFHLVPLRSPPSQDAGILGVQSVQTAQAQSQNEPTLPPDPPFQPSQLKLLRFVSPWDTLRWAGTLVVLCFSLAAALCLVLCAHR